MPVTPGELAAAVRATQGQPSCIYPTGPGTMLAYAKRPAGQVTYMARIGPDQQQSMMYVHFDPAGAVRRVINTPPEREESRHRSHIKLECRLSLMRLDIFTSIE